MRVRCAATPGEGASHEFAAGGDHAARDRCVRRRRDVRGRERVPALLVRPRPDRAERDGRPIRADRGQARVAGGRDAGRGHPVLPRDLQPAVAGAAGFDVDVLPRRGGPVAVAADPPPEQPDLPAQDRSRDPPAGAHRWTVTMQLKTTYKPREYCVQYRETDFEFASRLMEEEGIYYFFKHTSGGHTMVLANTPQSHPETSPGTAIYEEIVGGNRPEQRVTGWQRTQQLRSGKVTLWDHNFELPGKHLEAEKQIVETVQAGTVSHKFKLANNDKLEIYDYPGDYANRFDGVGR